jgi:hypothetical protein
MNCEEVQSQLLEYLDRSLDTFTTKHLDIHLTSCPPCRAEADSLADCIQQVAALPIVDAPLGFAQRVMAHAREIERRPSIWRRLAIPWHRGRPIQATAVVLIAIFSAYIYQREQPAPLEPFQSETETEQATTAATQLEAARTITPAEVTAPVVADRNSPSRQQAPAESAAASPSTSAASNVTPPATPNTEREIREPIPSQAAKRAPIQVQGVATGREASRINRESFGLGDFPFAAPRQPSLRSAAPTEGPIFSMSEPNADIEFVVRRRSAQQPYQAESESTDAVRKSAEADANTPSAFARRATPSLSGMIVETRWFTVAHEHLEQFKKDLSAQTVIESESIGAKREQDLTAKGERPLAIKVMILPATDR